MPCRKQDEAKDFWRVLMAPPARYSPAYFWSLNAPLEWPALRAQLNDMRACGVRSVCIHPMPPEFRPTTFFTRMEPAYLGRDYMQLIRQIVDTCAQQDMHFYLYDEGAWPSGTAAGRVFARDPARYAQKKVIFAEAWIQEGDAYQVPDTVLCAAVRDDSGWRVYRPGEIMHADTDRQFRTFYVKLDQPQYPCRAPYPDLLCRDAVASFIAITHERYKQAVGHEFGKTVCLAFTDEPAAPFVQLPFDGRWQLSWSTDFADEFLKRKGYDLIQRLPELFDPPPGRNAREVTKARIDYYDVWSRLFVERYLEPIRSWCRSNLLISGGHLGGEDEPVNNARAGFGHILRSLRALDMPGVDAIWRQIHPSQGGDYFYPRYASSVARQQNRPFVMSESFMIYGSGLSPAEMKWVVDSQFARGVTLFVFGHYQYATADHYMPMARPFFGPKNPFWPYLKPFHEYCARVSYWLSCGKPDCQTAVYYPVRDIWAGGAYQSAAIDRHHKIGAHLQAHQIEFDFIDDDVLDPACVHNGGLRVGHMQYSTIVMPKCAWMPPESLRALHALLADGGRVIAVDGAPAVDDNSGAPVIEDGGSRRGNKMIVTGLDALYQHVKPVCCLHPAQGDMRVIQRVGDNWRVYFLMNEGRQTIRCDGHFAERGHPLLFKASEGSFHPLNNEKKDSAICIPLTFVPGESQMIVFLDDEREFPNIGPERPDFAQARTVCRLETGWSLQPVRRFVVGEHDYTAETLPSSSVIAGQLGDWGNYIGRDFSGDVNYIIKFTLDTVPSNGEAPRGNLRRQGYGGQAPRGSLLCRSNASGCEGWIFAEPCEAKNAIPPCGSLLRRSKASGCEGREPQRFLAKKGALHLSLGDVKYACSVRLNGIELGQRAWAPFIYPIEKCLKAGDNELVVTVTNTLANAIIKPGILEQWQQRVSTGDWPAIDFHFDKMTRAFEEESLASGLFGPVQILMTEWISCKSRSGTHPGLPPAPRLRRAGRPPSAGGGLKKFRNKSL